MYWNIKNLFKFCVDKIKILGVSCSRDIRCYSIVWLGLLRAFSVLSPCHLRVIAGGNTFKRGMNQDEDI